MIKTEKTIEYRKVFDTIPEQFDRFRPRYSADLFAYFIEKAGIGAETKVLEIGPGTGQATDPILDTGCDYNAIELGEHLYAKMKEKYGDRSNFSIVNDDFITHDFGEQKFDVIYSAATIQWIPERIAFPKTLELLKPGGTLAMMFLIGDYKTPNEKLYAKIQKVYDEYYKPVTEYKNMKEPFDYLHATDYGYVDMIRRDFYGKRSFTADEYVQYCGTHSDHIVIPESYKTKFFEGLRQAVLDAGNKVEFMDTYVLYLAKKPLISLQDKTVYYQDEKLTIRSMMPEDARVYYDMYLSYDWHPQMETYEKYYREQQNGERLVFVPEYEGKVVGICTLVLHPTEGPWGGQNIPEIVDLCVFFHIHKSGIGSKLLDVAEAEAAKRSDMVFLAVGCHSGYGPAQRIYVKRGYIPDGSGVWYQNRQLDQYAPCVNDDDLLLFMSKELK